MAIRHTTVKRRIASLSALQVIITAVANIAESRHADTRGLGQQRNLVRADLQVACLHAAISKPIVHDAALADRLLRLHRPFQAL